MINRFPAPGTFAMKLDLSLQQNASSIVQFACCEGTSSVTECDANAIRDGDVEARAVDSEHGTQW